MKRRSLLIISTLVLAACAPTRPSQMGDGGMMRDRGMMQGSFLPARDRDIAGLPEAKPMGVLEVKDGDTIALNPELVRAEIIGKPIAMYAYNGQFPGPTLKIKQGSTFTVNVTNNIDLPTTIHWHGIRLENKFDGAAGVTQEAIEPGESFTYTVKVPDEGIFWYHPHVREDLQQDMGLYGLIHVTPEDADAYPPVNREEYVILDDILIEGGVPVPYGKNDADHALMGRFGNTYLINGTPVALGTDQDPPPSVQVQRGETVRFYIANVANTRTFNLVYTIPGKVKMVGADAGRVEREEFAGRIVLSPSERVIIDILFDASPRLVSLTHEPPGGRRVDVFGVEILPEITRRLLSQEFHATVQHDDVARQIDLLRPFFDKPIDKTIHLSVESMPARMMGGTAGGMQHGGGHGSTPLTTGGGSAAEGNDGIEWEDPMPQVNAMSSKHNTKWKLIDEASAKENMDIAYQFNVGDKVKIRLVNDKEANGSDHPMQHPIHFHGQRFLILSVNGEPNENLVWKDTVLVPKDATVDILLDVTNPGDWMMHCHIAEHLTNGMMGLFTVK